MTMKLLGYMILHHVGWENWTKQLLGKRKVQNNKIKNKNSVSGDWRFLAERVVFLGALSWSSFSRGIWEGSWGGRLL